MMKVSGILETIIYTSDLDASEQFYTKVLGLEFVTREENKFVFFRCGHRMFLVFNPDATAEQTHLPQHGAHGSQHVAFSIRAAELDQWRKHLEQSGVKIEQDVQWENGSRSVYFRDPAGNSVELASPVIWNLPEII
jgi:catechol 2,3-dioxygenase-like lactoylglutathione lyase family enzyme